MTLEVFLTLMLIMHIAGGTMALLSGLIAMFTAKGGKYHRLAGKVYFWSMTAVFVGAVVVAIGHANHFLLMVGFFSYYMTVRGYRILYLKKLHSGQKASIADWLITIVAGVFILVLFGWGIYVLQLGSSMGIVSLVFAVIGTSFLISDLRNFSKPPKDKMHWWYGHISSMGGSYISAVTAFIVVNIHIPQYQWTLWVIPAVVGGILIGRNVRKYKLQFAGPISKSANV